MSDSGIVQGMFDLIDETTSDIILHLDNRSKNFEALQFFMQSLPNPLRKEKELHLQIASILTCVTACDPYDMTYADSKNARQTQDEKLLEDPPPLLYWSHKHWDALSTQIYSLMNALEVEYNKTLEIIFSSIVLHEKLSRIRVQIEEELAEKSSGKIDVDNHWMLQFAKEVATTEEPHIQQELEKLLLVPSISSQRLSEVRLKPIEDLKFILREIPFSFEYFQRKLQKLILIWAREQIPSLKPYLDKENWEPRAVVPPQALDDKDSPRVNQKYKINRNNKLEAENSRKEGKENEKKTFSAKVTNSLEVPFENESVVIIVGDAESIGSPQEQLHLTGAKRRRPIRFSQEEKNALREGVETFGIGKWSKIRNAFPELHHRNNLKALKVCFGTMLKKGEIIMKEENVEYDDTTSADHGSPNKKIRLEFAPMTRTSKLSRKSWTTVEKAAVFNGVVKYGVGFWKKIKEDQDFAEALDGRTAIQIKDCYRVLKKSDEWGPSQD